MAFRGGRIRLEGKCNFHALEGLHQHQTNHQQASNRISSKRCLPSKIRRWKRRFTLKFTRWRCSVASGVARNDQYCDGLKYKANCSKRNAQCGIEVAEHTKNTFTELQRKKVHRYVVFKIDEKKKEVVVEKAGGPAESYDDFLDDFLASLPENDCRYAVYDYDFVNSENCQKSKIFFIAWSPSASRIHSKMLYTTSKDKFRRELEGIHYEIHPKWILRFYRTEPSEAQNNEPKCHFFLWFYSKTELIKYFVRLRCLELLTWSINRTHGARV